MAEKRQYHGEQIFSTDTQKSLTQWTIIETMSKKIHRGRFHVYIIECSDGTYYTGYTNDLEKRLRRHNEGSASKYTRKRLPARLVWSKKCISQRAAMRTEVRIKLMRRKDKASLVSGARFDNVWRKYRK